MKYLVLRRTWCAYTQEVPIIFPKDLMHSQVFDSVKSVVGMEDAEVISAGFLHMLNAPYCYGNSDTLRATSRGAIDAAMIKDFINSRGILD
jgi:hypothetical protein